MATVAARDVSTPDDPIHGVPVEGGELGVRVWGEPGADRPVVVFIHGITATHMAFPPLARALAGECTMIAPDLRGRGASRELGPPYGMARHADDVVSTLDHFDVKTALVVGHSMGGFVATALARHHPGRIERIVLLDGGVPLQVPQDLPADELAEAVVGPAAARLRMEFTSEEAYLDYWKQHPALGGDQWNDDVERYLRYDLIGAPPALRSSCRLDALHADTTDTLLTDEPEQALRHAGCPMILVRATRGLLNQEPPLYPDDWLRPWLDRVQDLRRTTVPDTNHYTLVLMPAAVEAVAGVIRTELR